MSTTTAAGRELDALVAEKVMGWTVCRDASCGGCEATVLLMEDGWRVRAPLDQGGWPLGWWTPSTDIAAAWEVVEKLRVLGFNVSVSCAHGMRTWDVRGWKADNTGRFIAHAETAPLAICLAALDALGVHP